MRKRKIESFLTTMFPAFFLTISTPLKAQVIHLKDITPTCPAPYQSVPVAGKCAHDDSKINDFNTEPSCKASLGLSWNGSRCTFVTGKEATPSCGTATTDLAFENGECVIDHKVPRSASGDYVGDYFHITATSSDYPDVVYQQGAWIRVMSQQNLGEQDRELTVVASEPPCAGLPFCGRPLGGQQAKTMKASSLAALGVERVGWTYGVLALPFKYHTGSRSFSSQVSLGPYLGRRYGAPGSAFTFALAAAIGSVKGEVRDAQNNVTSTPDLQAYSIAGGVMWDISKAPNIKPFKLGMFLGADMVSKDNVVKFKDDRKLWLAFQIGFDFTDN